MLTETKFKSDVSDINSPKLNNATAETIKLKLNQLDAFEAAMMAIKIRRHTLGVDDKEGRK